MWRAFALSSSLVRQDYRQLQCLFFVSGFLNTWKKKKRIACKSCHHKKKPLTKDKHWNVSCSVMSDSFSTPWTADHQALLSMEFSRQEYQSGVSFLSPGNLPNSRIELRSPALQADSLLSEPPGRPSLALRSYSIKVFFNIFKLS